jgi:hypothetical protein
MLLLSLFQGKLRQSEVKGPTQTSGNEAKS